MTGSGGQVDPAAMEHWFEQIASKADQALHAIGEVKEEQIHTRLSVDGLTARVDKQNGRVLTLEQWRRTQEDKDLAIRSYNEGAATAFISWSRWKMIGAVVGVIAAAATAGAGMVQLFDQVATR